MDVFGRKDHEWVTEEEEIKQSKDWKRVYLSLYPTKTNYRSTEGSEHAICRNGECKVHVDDHHPHNEPLKHIKEDVPLSEPASLLFFIALLISVLKKIIERKTDE